MKKVFVAVFVLLIGLIGTACGSTKEVDTPTRERNEERSFDDFVGKLKETLENDIKIDEEAFLPQPGTMDSNGYMYIDPFESVLVSFHGADNYGTVEVISELDVVERMLGNIEVKADSKNGLSNGDKVAVSLSYYGKDVTELFNKYGYMPTRTEKKYKVEGLKQYVASMKELSQDIIDDMIEEGRALCISDIKSNSRFASKLKTVEKVSDIVMSPKIGVDYEKYAVRGNKITFIYEISFDEMYVEGEEVKLYIGVDWYGVGYDENGKMDVNPERGKLYTGSALSNRAEYFYSAEEILQRTIYYGEFSNSKVYRCEYSNLPELYRVELYGHHNKNKKVEFDPFAQIETYIKAGAPMFDVANLDFACEFGFLTYERNVSEEREDGRTVSFIVTDEKGNTLSLKELTEICADYGFKPTRDKFAYDVTKDGTILFR